MGATGDGGEVGANAFSRRGCGWNWMVYSTFGSGGGAAGTAGGGGICLGWCLRQHRGQRAVRGSFFGKWLGSGRSVYAGRGGLCTGGHGSCGRHVSLYGALASFMAHSIDARSRGVSSHLESGGCRHFLWGDLDLDSPKALFSSGRSPYRRWTTPDDGGRWRCSDGLTRKAAHWMGSTQSPCWRMRSINASTASDSGTFRRTTSFSLYRVILPGPVPTYP